jgi:hypothetical protein
LGAIDNLNQDITIRARKAEDIVHKEALGQQEFNNKPR